MMLTIEERWHWWRSLGSPRYVCAPMVLQSELAFRMLIRRHGTTLCYAPMLPAAAFLSAPTDGSEQNANTGGPATQAQWFTTCEGDRPLLAQIGGRDPDEVLAAARLVQDSVDGVDVNFGCPQRCAERDGYGAYLMDEPELARQIVARLACHLRVPVTAKMRICARLEETLAFARMLEDAGAACVCVHGRRREKAHHEDAADWDVIAAVKAHLSVPVSQEAAHMTRVTHSSRQSSHACSHPVTVSQLPAPARLM